MLISEECGGEGEESGGGGPGILQARLLMATQGTFSPPPSVPDPSK